MDKDMKTLVFRKKLDKCVDSVIPCTSGYGCDIWNIYFHPPLYEF